MERREIFGINDFKADEWEAVLEQLILLLPYCQEPLPPDVFRKGVCKRIECAIGRAVFLEESVAFLLVEETYKKIEQVALLKQKRACCRRERLVQRIRRKLPWIF